MNIFNAKTISVALVFCTLSGVSAISQAETRNINVATKHVSFADLDLTEADGQDVLKRRVRGAARQVCGTVYSKSAGDLGKNHQCRQYAVMQALRQVGLQEELTVAVNAR